jgi:hypothetical protein
MNFADQSSLPVAGFHIFYDRRVADVADELPKYSGYWKSEWAATKPIISTLMHKRSA